MAKYLSKVLTIRVSEAEHKALSDEAEARGVGLSDYVRDLIRGAAAQGASGRRGLSKAECELIASVLAEASAARTYLEFGRSAQGDDGKVTEAAVQNIRAASKSGATEKLMELGLL